MKKIVVLCLLTIVALAGASAQSYNQERMALENFLVRMYRNAPFEGVKIVSDYQHNYLLSVVLVKKSASESNMNRVAQLKSSRQVSQYLNGVISTESETIIRTTEEVKEERTIEEITDIIKENSIGFTKAMEILKSFDANDKEKCYMFFRKVEEMND
ncbi:MAG: hypothetical protein ACI37U_02795 [Bacteroides sp.]